MTRRVFPVAEFRNEIFGTQPERASLGEIAGACHGMCLLQHGIVIDDSSVNNKVRGKRIFCSAHGPHMQVMYAGDTGYLRGEMNVFIGWTTLFVPRDSGTTFIPCAGTVDYSYGQQHYWYLYQHTHHGCQGRS